MRTVSSIVTRAVLLTVVSPRGLQLVMLDYKKDNTYMHLLLHNQP
jgi:hypothetical protein